MTKANPESGFGPEIGTFMTALDGDFGTAIDHLSAYAARAALMGKSRYEPPSNGLISNLSNADLEKITAMLGKSDKQKAQKKLVSAIATYFKADYIRSAAASNQLSQAGEGRKQSRMSAGDLALALNICNDQMLAVPSDVEAKALRLVQQTGEDKGSLSLLDTTYFVLNQRDKSLEFINHLIERESAKAAKSKSNAKVIDLLYARASIDEQMKETRSAMHDCEAILKLDANQAKARLDVCRYKLMFGENQGVLAELNNYLATYPGEGAAHFLRAQIFVLDSKWQPAVNDLTAAIDDGYYLLKSLQARAACYRSMHQNSLAAKDIALVKYFKLDEAAIVLEVSPGADPEKLRPTAN
jgi:hypothetical protein